MATKLFMRAKALPTQGHPLFMVLMLLLLLVQLSLGSMDLAQNLSVSTASSVVDPEIMMGNLVAAVSNGNTLGLESRDGFNPNLLTQLKDTCVRLEKCVLHNDNNNHCGEGYKSVGWEACDDKGSKRKPICCRTQTAPETCKWRGSGKNCNGQCHTGEVNLFQSKRGGGEHRQSGMGKCRRGTKTFCCKEPQFDELVAGCKWTGCGGHCGENQREVAYAKSIHGKCRPWKQGTRFCCPKYEPPPLEACHWVGKGDCAHNTCNSGEVTLGRTLYGDSKWSCNWERKKSLCCGINPKARHCGETLCHLDNSYRCGEDPWADLSEEAEELPHSFAHLISGRPEKELTNRDETSHHEDFDEEEDIDIDFSNLNETELQNLESRGRGGRRVLAKTVDYRRRRFQIRVLARNYPGSSRLHNSARGIPAASTVFRNDLPSLPRAGASRSTRTPNDYFMDRFGSTGNRTPLLLAERNMNQVKGRVFARDVSPQSPEKFDDAIQNSIRTGRGEQVFLEPIRQVILVFRYMNMPQARRQIQRNRQELLTASRRISTTVSQLQALHDIHQEFDYNWYLARTNEARHWVESQLVQIATIYQQNGAGSTNYQAVMTAIGSLWNDVKYIKPPPEDPADL
ncbi:glycosyl hydrolase family 71 [Fusarium albosuccineum]|uniref:Glycosyl hydrolase family 71 n=1 Tax=Fusarium albosuccineum TaxID=1237068 RepID=A0A8H4LPR2_9HYPO|nr:glycosyl hydrolase family 71 [Fusarium albosuccineum]